VSWRHGTTYGYDKGCRCNDCRETKLAKRRLQRDKARAARSPAYLRELATSRALKERYRGRCRYCGAATTGSDGPDAAPTVCIACAPAHYGPIYAAARRGHGPHGEKALAFLARPRRYSEIRDHLSVSNNQTDVLLNRLVRYGLIRRVSRGVYERVAA